MIIRLYYRARERIPAVMRSMWGAGVYGLSAAGRARFAEFPDIVAEDLFVDQYFGAGDLVIVGDDPVTVVAPAKFRDLLRVMRRAYRGAAEIRAASLAVGSGRKTASVVSDIARLASSDLSGLCCAAVYVFVAIVARLYIVFGRRTRWERDESSRASSLGASS
jgi:hypothetical protein